MLLNRVVTGARTLASVSTHRAPRKVPSSSRWNDVAEFRAGLFFFLGRGHDFDHELSFFYKKMLPPAVALVLFFLFGFVFGSATILVVRR